MTDAKGSSIVKEGFLVKSPPPDKLMAAWHKRYFVLWSGGFMEYYSSSDKKPQDYLKTIDLNGCEDMVAPYPISGRTYIIKVALAVKGKSRDYFFDCENQYSMEDWVGVLAEVCGFTAVDCEVEEDNFDVVSPSPSSLSPPPPLLRPQVSDRSPSPSLANRPKLRPPLPPPKSTSTSPHGYDESALYEDPNLVEFSNQYSSDGLTEDLYDCRISDRVLQKLNTEPPPVWKNPANSTPPPLPPTRHSRRFTKSLQVPSSNRDLPPPLPYRSSKDEPPLSTKKLPKVPKLPSPFLPKANKPRPANKRATTPPAMPLAPNFKADLGSKLKQRQNMTRSWSEDEQPPYEDVDYSIESKSKREFSPRSQSKSEESTESDTGSYVDCDPNEPQSYLDYSKASSMFRNDPQPNGRDWSPMPLPLPPRATITPASISDDDDESAPPVPRRHPQASGRSLPKQSNSGRFSPHGVNNNLLPLPPRSKSPIPEDDDAPPVPARGPESTRPPLNRPHSEKNTNSLLTLPPSRGISVPAGGTRLPMPPPKFVTGHIETDDNDIFQKVDFDKKRKNHRDNSPVPKEPKQNIQPSWKTGDVSNRSSDNKPSRYPLPIPKSTIPSKLAPSSKPLTSAMLAKPKPTLPPPVSNKPKSPKHSSFDSSSTDSGVSQVQRNIDAMNRSSAVSPRIKKKLPDPTLSNGTETRSKLTLPNNTGIKKSPATAPKNPGLGKKIPELTETRRKLADPSFLSKLSETTSSPPGFKPQKTLPDSSAPYIPETRRKYPNGIESTTRVPHSEHRSRPEITKKPPPTPKEKPVLNKFQNSDLAACLQSNNNPSSRRPGASSHKPVAPLKPKPLLPPSYR